MVTIESVTDFSCLVHENGTEGDCDLRPLADEIVVLPPNDSTVTATAE